MAAGLHVREVTVYGCTYQSAEQFVPADQLCLRLSCSQQCDTCTEGLQL